VPTLILTARIEEKNERHARIGVWQNGAKAGTLCVEAEHADLLVGHLNGLTIEAWNETLTERPDRTKHEPIPADFEVQPINPKDVADWATCGYCGLSWDDGKITSMTPAPSGRCPFEYFHIYPES
jgi:hypothetical protein